MALPVNSIGSFTVRNWISGSPPPVAQKRTEILSYPGIDHVAVRVLETRAIPFVLESTRDCANMTQAHALAIDYSEMVSDGPHRLVWNDIDYDDHGVRALVLSVEPRAIRKKSCISGALTAGNTVDLVARWELIFTEYP